MVVDKNAGAKMTKLAKDDEIDLFEIFGSLWNAKWTISIFLVLAIFLGLVFMQFFQPRYIVSANYLYNFYSVRAENQCDKEMASVKPGRLGCIEKKTNQKFKKLLAKGWKSNGDYSRLTLTTSEPLDIDQYLSELDEINKRFTSEINEEVTNEIDLLESELTKSMLNSDIVIAKLLNAKRKAYYVNQGQKILDVYNVKIVQSHPKFESVLGFSIIFGLFFGSVFVLIRKAVRERVKPR